jgi:hypothetical protein
MSEVTELHEPFRSWLKSQGLCYRYSRPDRATSENASDADFWIVENGRVLMLEMKQPKTGKLSTNQIFRHAELAKAGCRVFVVRELSRAIELVTAWRSFAPLPEAPSAEKLLRVFNAFYRETERGLERVKSAL